MKLLRIVLILLFVVMTGVDRVEATHPTDRVVTMNGEKYYLHTVADGETLYSLSKNFGVSIGDITGANRGLTPQTLYAGMKIYIPVAEVKASEVKSQEGAAQDSHFLIHVVREGDTLYSIARAHKISVAVIEEDNPGIDASTLSIGMELRIRRSERGYATSKQIEREQMAREQQAAQEQAAQEQVQLAEGEHLVKAGETVYSLSRRYGMSEQEFLDLNDMFYGDLKAGMVVRVKAQQGVEEQPSQIEGGDSEGGVVEQELPVSNMAEIVPEGDVAPITASQMVDEETLYNEWLRYVMGYNDNVFNTGFRPIDVDFWLLGRRNVLQCALMLPFSRSGKINVNYVNFYKGVLMAMEDLKAEGISVKLSVFDTMASSSRIYNLLSYEPAILDAQLIIGPAYADELRPVVNFAEQNQIPIVSPLADVDELRSSALFQMQPEGDYEFEKFAEFFAADREIIVIYTSNLDTEFLSQVTPLMREYNVERLNYTYNRGSFFYKRQADGSNGSSVSIGELLRRPSKKSFVIVARDEVDVDRILVTLSSEKSNIVARSMGNGNYVVVGNRKWTHMKGIDKKSFFHNNVAFVVPYHAKRDSEVIRLFDSRYIKTFGTLPTMFSYRGYDAAMIFCRKMFGRGGFVSGDEGLNDIANDHFTPLATTYRFSFEDGLYTNYEWTMEHYHDDYTIEIK